MLKNVGESLVRESHVMAKAITDDFHSVYLLEIRADTSISAAEGWRRPKTSLAQRDFTMGGMTRRVFEASVNVGPFKVREIFQDLLRRHATGKQFEHMANRNSHTANRRFTSADIRYYGDAIHHTDILNEPEKNTTFSAWIDSGLDQGMMGWNCGIESGLTPNFELGTAAQRHGLNGPM